MKAGDLRVRLIRASVWKVDVLPRKRAGQETMPILIRRDFHTMGMGVVTGSDGHTAASPLQNIIIQDPVLVAGARTGHSLKAVQTS